MMLLIMCKLENILFQSIWNAQAFLASAEIRIVNQTVTEYESQTYASGTVIVIRFIRITGIARATIISCRRLPVRGFGR